MRSYMIGMLARKSTQTSVRENFKVSTLVVTAIKSTETSSWDETRTECMHFDPYSLAVYAEQLK